MAIFSVNNSNNRFTLTLTVTETAYSVADNTSTLAWSLDLKANTSYNFSLYSFGLNVVLNNTTVKSQTRAQRIQYSIDDYGTVNLASGSGFVVNHNDDGTKTIPVAFSIDVKEETFTPGPLSGSGTMSLTTIARYSTLTIPTGSTLGDPQTIKVTRPSSLTHTVKWSCGTVSGTLCTNSTSTSLSFTPDISLAAQNTVDDKVTITYTITTTGVGDKSYPVSYAIPAGVKPSLTVGVSDDTSYNSTFGGYVQGWSKLKITCYPELAHGSPIASYNVTAEGKTYTTNPAVTDVIKSDSKVAISAYVTDQRRRSSAVVPVEITVLPYSAPKVTLTAYRCDEQGNRNDEGGYMKLVLTATISSLNGKNTADYTITYSGGASGKITGTGVSYTSNAIACSASSPCSIEVEVKDKLSKGTASAAIPIAFTLMEFYNTGKGVAFGKVATRDGLDCAMPAYFSGATALPSSMTVGGKTLINLIYPVGSIYMSVNSTSPATFLGGTWERIQDKFLLAAGSTYSAGSTGGSATHTLSVSELPAHNHYVIDTGNTAHVYSSSKALATSGGSWAARLTANYGSVDVNSETYKLTTSAKGDGAAHNNMPPYLTVYMWKRTA